ncbi:hypothetical protein BJX99DRAFT_258919 [Aspergillus californicus]
MASASRNKAKTPLSVLKNLELAIKDALPLSDTIASMDGLQRDKDTLTKQLESANKEIQDRENRLKEKAGELNNVLRAFEDRYCEWSKEKAALDTELQTLRQEVERSRREAQRVAAAQQKKYESTQADLQSQLEKQMILGKGLKVRLEEAESDLRNLKKDVGLDYRSHECLAQVRNLEHSLHSLCAKSFQMPAIPPSKNETRLIAHHSGSSPRTSRLTSSMSSSVYPLPLLAQAVIAHQLSTEVFSQLYITSPTGRLSMGEAIERSEDIRPQQKAVLRNLLMATFSTEDKRSRDDMLESVSSFILRELKSMLSTLSPQTVGDFKNELVKFLQSAGRVWDMVRRDSRWIMATCESEVYPEMWRPYEDENSDFSPSEPSQAALILFPHLYCEGNEKPLYYGSMWLGYSQYRAEDGSNTSFAHQGTRIDRGSHSANLEEERPTAGDSRKERPLKMTYGANATSQGSDVNRSLSRKSHFSDS